MTTPTPDRSPPNELPQPGNGHSAAADPVPPVGSPRSAPRPVTKKRALLIGIGLVAIIFGCTAGYGVISATAPEPRAGDCLTGLSVDVFGRAGIVECSDPSATHKVVAQTDSIEGAATICKDHPGGESHTHDTSTRSSSSTHVQWVVCVVLL